jgi:BON domain
MLLFSPCQRASREYSPCIAFCEEKTSNNGERTTENERMSVTYASQGLHRSLTTRISSAFSQAAIVAATSGLLFVAGCHKTTPTVDDATLNTNVHTALSSDKAIASQPIQVDVQSGKVTLTGNVSDDTASTVAAQDAARVPGVKLVVNNTTVAGVQVPPTITSATAPDNPRRATPEEQQQIANNTLPAPAEPPPPPPPPTYRNITLAAGASIPVRITQTLETGQTQTGDTFSGVVTSAVVREGVTVIPGGSAVSGRVVEAKDAAHFKGSSLLSIELTALRRKGELITISTQPYSVKGKGRGKNTAVKVGGGAAVGAVLGGILSGDKGAAIGAAAGAGTGAAVQGFTKGEQVHIPSESVITFHLASPITVRVLDQPAADTSAAPANTDGTTPTLQTHPQQ